MERMDGTYYTVLRPKMIGVKIVRVFLSHSSMDKPLVSKVYDNLNENIAWIDKVNIENGDNIPDKIGEGIQLATHFVLFWSKSASKSNWVKAELNAAFVQMMSSKCKFMIFLIDDIKLPVLLQPYKYEIVNSYDLDISAKNIADKILAQEGAPTNLSKFVNRTLELGEIEEAAREKNKLIILYGMLGIGKSSLALRAIDWIYNQNRGMIKKTLDFQDIPGIPELAIKLSEITRHPLQNENKTIIEQQTNIRYFFGYISASNILIVLKDVKSWLEDDGKPNSGLLFLIQIIVDTDIFSYVPIITSSRYITLSIDFERRIKQINIRGMQDKHIDEIIKNNLPNTFPVDEKKNISFAERMYGYPLGAKLAANRIAIHGYDYYLDQEHKINELKVSLAKEMISYADLSLGCLKYIKIVAISKSSLRNEEYMRVFPELQNKISEHADEAFFAGILKFDDGCYKMEGVVADYFYNLAFNDSERKEITEKLEKFLVEEIQNSEREKIDKYMRLLPLAVHILTLNNKYSQARELRSELVATISRTMWDQYNHREYEAAYNTADGLLLSNENDREALYVKALCLTRFDEYEKANKILLALLNSSEQHSLKDKAKYYYALGRVKKRQGDYEDAIEYFHLAVRRDNKYLSPYRELGDCYIHIGKIKEAESAINQAKKIDSSNLFLVLQEARLLQKMDQPDKAIALLSLQSILNQDPAQMFFRKGRAYDQLGNKLQAQECYEKALEYDSRLYDAELCLLNQKLEECSAEEIKKKIKKLKNVLKGKRLHILTNIEARFLGYYGENNREALVLLDGVPVKYRDKQWYAVRMQLLERLINENKSCGRNLIANEYEAEQRCLQEDVSKRFGDRKINFEVDLIPDT